MDRAVRVGAFIGSVKVVVVAVALLLLVPLGARIGNAAQETDATPGASPAAAPEASPSATPGTIASNDRGSITVRVLACDDATTVENFDPGACDTVSGDTALEVARSGGEPLTVDDSLRLSSGVYRWTRLPYGDYTVSLTGIPGGAGSVLAVIGQDGTPADVTTSGLEITIDAVDSGLTVSLYLLAA